MWGTRKELTSEVMTYADRVALMHKRETVQTRRPKTRMINMLGASPRHNTKDSIQPPRSRGSSWRPKTSSTSQSSGFFSESAKENLRPRTAKSSAKSRISQASFPSTSGIVSDYTSEVEKTEEQKLLEEMEARSKARRISARRSKAEATKRRSTSAPLSTVKINSNLHISTTLSSSTLDLIEASEKGDRSKVHDLIEDKNLKLMFSRMKEIRNPLHRACGYGQLGAVEELVNAGVNVNQTTATGRNALHEACIGGHVNILAYLVGKLNINHGDKDGIAPLHLAAQNGDVQCVKVLIENGALVNIQDNQMRTPGHYAVMRNQHPVLRKLLDEMADLDAQDCNGKTLSHYAAQYGAFESLNYLIKQDCNFKQEDNSGQQAVHYAAAFNKINILRGLIRNAQCSLHTIDGRGRTPLHHAAMKGSLRCLHWLLENGAAPNFQDDENNCPLHLAAEFGRIECYNCLLQHDANQEMINNKEETPIQSARRGGHPKAVALASQSVSNCPLCTEQNVYELWNMDNQPPLVNKSIQKTARKLYFPPAVPKTQKVSQLESNRLKRSANEKDLLPKRDIVTRYITDTKSASSG